MQVKKADDGSLFVNDMVFARPQLVSLFLFLSEQDPAEEFMFDEPNSENVRFTTPLEALEEILAEHTLAVTGDVEAWLESQVEFVHITAYQRESVTEGTVEEEADWHLETLRERFGDEYGDEDGDDRIADEHLAEVKKRFTDAIAFYYSKAFVYRCKSLRSWTLDNNDILELIRQIFPAWLKKSP